VLMQRVFSGQNVKLEESGKQQKPLWIASDYQYIIPESVSE
jgi:hypothetical protein